MKQKLDGNSKLHNASSRNSLESGAGSTRYKVEEKRVGWRDSAASSFKMQMAAKKKLSPSWKEEEHGPEAASIKHSDGVDSKVDQTRGDRRSRGDGVVKVTIEKVSNNSRKIVGEIPIGAPLEVVWGILTDYEHLADFVPSLAESRCLEKRANRARLYQVGEQNLALGLKFRSKVFLNCEEKPTELLENTMRRDIDFESAEGVPQIFRMRGTWRLEQQVSRTFPGGLRTMAEARGGGGGGGYREAEARAGGNFYDLEGGQDEASTLLSYNLTLQPKAWLPVGLVESRLTSDVIANLASIRDRSLQHQGRGPGRGS